MKLKMSTYIKNILNSCGWFNLILYRNYGIILLKKISLFRQKCQWNFFIDIWRFVFLLIGYYLIDIPILYNLDTVLSLLPIYNYVFTSLCSIRDNLPLGRERRIRVLIITIDLPYLNVLTLLCSVSLLSSIYLLQ